MDDTIKTTKYTCSISNREGNQACKKVSTHRNSQSICAKTGSLRNIDARIMKTSVSSNNCLNTSDLYSGGDWFKSEPSYPDGGFSWFS
jgi:hypothetical protein